MGHWNAQDFHFKKSLMHVYQSSPTQWGTLITPACGGSPRTSCICGSVIQKLIGLWTLEAEALYHDRLICSINPQTRSIIWAVVLFLVGFLLSRLCCLEPQWSSLWSWVTRLLWICGYSLPLSCHHHYLSSNTRQIASKANCNALLQSYRVKLWEAWENSQYFCSLQAAAGSSRHMRQKLSPSFLTHMIVLLQVQNTRL